MINVHGWQRALDVQMDTHRWCGTDMGTELNAAFFHLLVDKLRSPVYDGVPSEVMREGSRTTAREFQQLLWQADTCYITSDMMHLLLQAAHDLPDDVRWDVRSLITPMGFCLFEESIHGQDANDETIGVGAIAWHVAHLTNRQGDPFQAIHTFFLTDTEDPEDTVNPEVRENFGKLGVPLPPMHLAHWYPAIDGALVWKEFKTHESGTGITRAVLKLFAAFNLLAQQTIGAPMKMRPDRAARKRFERHFGRDHEERMITLITLRRKSAKKDPGEPAEEIPWSRRWVVRGHWRKQWYPKLKRHDWKYIHEYIKGPEDKPLIITERRVFNFRR